MVELLYQHIGVPVVLRKNLNVTLGLYNGLIGFLDGINLNNDGNIQSLIVTFGSNRRVIINRTYTDHIHNILFDGFPISLHSSLFNFHLQGIDNSLF
jgi:hypothetical protein